MNKKHNEWFVKMLSNARLSDRKLSKLTNTSQPTITRFRNKLLNENVIRSYQLIPNFEKIGYSIFAILEVKYAVGVKSELSFSEHPKLHVSQPTPYTELSKRPEVIFQAPTPVSNVVLTVHKSFPQFVEFVREIQLVADIKTIAIGLTEDISKFKIADLDVNLGK